MNFECLHFITIYDWHLCVYATEREKDKRGGRQKPDNRGQGPVVIIGINAPKPRNQASFSEHIGRGQNSASRPLRGLSSPEGVSKS